VRAVTDFQSLPTGVAPLGWASVWQAGQPWTVGDTAGEKHIQRALGAPGGTGAFTWTPVGSVADCDLVATFEFVANESVMLAGRVSGAAASETVVWAGAYPQYDVIALESVNAGVYAQLGVSVPMTLAVGDIVRIRLQLIGATARMKVWLAADPEPGAWAITENALAAGLQNAGGVGVVSTGAHSYRVLDLCVGTDADAVPVLEDTYSDTFAGEVVGSAPDNFAISGTGGDPWAAFYGSAATIELGDGGINVLRRSNVAGIGSLSGRRFLLAPLSGDTSCRFRMRRFDAFYPSEFSGAFLRGDLSTGSFIAAVFTDDAFELIEYTRYIANVRDTTPMALGVDDWVNVLVEASDATLRAKAWADADPEPGAWMLEYGALADTGRGEGASGIIGHESIGAEYSYFAVGTNGVGAPLPVAPTTPGAFTSPLAGAILGGMEATGWGASAGADTYELEYRLSPLSPWVSVSSAIVGNAHNWNTAAIEWAPQAQLRVRAANGAGASGWRESDVFVVWQGDIGTFQPYIAARTGWSVCIANANSAGLSRIDIRFFEENGVTPRSDVIEGNGGIEGTFKWGTGLPPDTVLSWAARAVTIDGVTHDWTQPVKFRTLNQLESVHGRTFHARDMMGKVQARYVIGGILGSPTPAGFAEFGIPVGGMYGFAEGLHAARLNLGDPQGAVPAVQDNLEGLWRQYVNVYDPRGRFVGGADTRSSWMVGLSIAIPEAYEGVKVEVVGQPGAWVLYIDEGGALVFAVTELRGQGAGTSESPGWWERPIGSVLYGAVNTIFVGGMQPSYNRTGGSPPSCVYDFAGTTELTVVGTVNGEHTSGGSSIALRDRAFCVDSQGQEFSLVRTESYASMGFNSRTITIGHGTANHAVGSDPWANGRFLQGYASSCGIWMGADHGRILDEAEREAITAQVQAGGDVLGAMQGTDPLAYLPLDDYSQRPRTPAVLVYR
jgi:hypothetical protein